MGNYINLFFVIFIFLSCDQNRSTSQKLDLKKSKNSIKKIEITDFDSSPKNYSLYKYKCISMERNTVNYIEYTYKNGELKNKEIIRSQKDLINNLNVFDNLPQKYLNKNETFGNPNSVDDGGISVLIFLESNKTITWLISHDYESLPKEIRMLILEYKKIKSDLKL